MCLTNDGTRLLEKKKEKPEEENPITKLIDKPKK